MDWVDFTTENAAGKYRNTSTFSKFRQRDAAAGQYVIPVIFPLVSRSGSTYSATPQVTRRIVLPSGINEFVVNLFVAHTAGSGIIKGEVVYTAGVSTTTATSAETTVTTAVYPAFIITQVAWVNLAPLTHDVGVDLKLYVRHGTGGTTYIATQDVSIPANLIGGLGGWNL